VGLAEEARRDIRLGPAFGQSREDAEIVLGGEANDIKVISSKLGLSMIEETDPM
jgi:hypothetical protein